MPPQLALELVNLLNNNLVGRRRTMIPVHIQVLITLRFLASGSYQIDLAQIWEHPVSQTTVSRCVNKVILAIGRYRDFFIKFPSTREERQRISHRLYSVFMKRIFLSYSF